MPGAAEWKKRSIYQVLTDRFATSGPDIPDPSIDVSHRQYCGGTWRGIVEKLDYIQGMGFDAIWISPVTKNIEEETFWGMAYHGYWQENIYELNARFGTAEDLLNLSEALHEKDMYLMVDVVVNHMASTSNVDFSRFVPFNDPSYYHPKKFITDYEDQKLVEEGWIGDSKVPLPDLDTENLTVAHTLYAWVAALVKNFNIDGLRIDTVKHVPQEFWPGFVRAAGVWCVGEMLHGDPDFLGSYQPFVGGLLDYAAYYPLQRAFQKSGGSMYEITDLLQPQYRRKFRDTQQLATFIESHDMPRFPGTVSADITVLQNALAWTVLTDGIPLIYYGCEQYFTGPSDMNAHDDQSSREVMWKSGYKKTALYHYLALLNRVRKLSWNMGFGSNLATAVHVDVNVAGIRKGPLLMILSNKGSKSAPRKISLHTTFPTGSILVNVLTCQSIAVKYSTNFTIIDGEPQVYLPHSLATQICAKIVPPPLPTNFAVKLFYRLFPPNTHSAVTSWSNGVPVVTHDILSPPSRDVTSGEVLRPPPKSSSSPYSIFWNSHNYRSRESTAPSG